MLPMGLKLTDFTKVNNILFTTFPFNFEDELSRDNKIFGMKPVKKVISKSVKNVISKSVKNKSKRYVNR